MSPSLEIKALGLALLTASVSLSGALLTASPIRMVADLNPARENSTPMAAPEPASAPETIAQGKQFFSMSCAECHGDDAHGDEGPDLHNLAVSNARIAATIKKGIKGEMPSFAKKYDDHQTADLVAYLRSLH